MATKPPCPKCQHVHCSTDVVTLGRFDASGPRGYRAVDRSEVFPTRAEAEADLCRARTPGVPS